MFFLASRSIGGFTASFLRRFASIFNSFLGSFYGQDTLTKFPRILFVCLRRKVAWALKIVDWNKVSMLRHLGLYAIRVSHCEGGPMEL